MRNAEYWKQRFAQLEAAQNEMSLKSLPKIEKQYKRAQKLIESDILHWYARLAKNNSITLAEARKLLSKDELEEFKWEVEEYIKRARENALDGRWVKELENASARFHISRLEALKIHTENSLQELFAAQHGTFTTLLFNTYQSGYYHTAFELQKGFGVGFEIAGLNQSQIEKVLAKPWAADGYNFSERIWKNKQKLISEVHRQITQNLLTGGDPQRAINAIAKRLSTSKSNAGRLVMTESAYFSSAAQGECYNNLGVEEYEILATLDAHTSDICREMDKKHFPMKDYQAGVTAPPFHPWCRSTTIPYFEENFGQIGERAARDVKTGKTYNVPADMTFEEWKQQQDALYGEGTVDKARKMYYNESADRKQWQAYRARLGNDVPTKFSDFQALKYDAPEQYKDLSEYYRYKGRVPEASKNDYRLYKSVKETGVIGSIRVPAAKIDIDKLQIKDAHALNHGCTLEDAKKYVKNAVCSIARMRWDGLHTGYYSIDGAAYVDEELKINTIFPSEEFDPMTRKVMEVFK